AMFHGCAVGAGFKTPPTLGGGRLGPPRLVRESFGERLRRALEELGPAFIKFGQILSDRGDLVPESIVIEMKKLQDAVAPFSAAEARARVEQSLGAPIDRLFLSFYDEVEGAASLAQVHRAILPTGQPVAVKIKRPGIEQRIQADIEILKQLAGFLDHRTHYFKVIKAREIVEEFETQILRELDFQEECLSVKKFIDEYRDDNTVAVPQVFEQYTTRDILVQEFIHGTKISDVITDGGQKFNKTLINERTADFILSQLFVHGHFHADPHPGNFMVLPGNVVCFIDFGMVYSLRPHEQEHLNLMMIGLSRLDSVLVARSLLRMGHAEGTVDQIAFESAVHDYVEAHLDRPLENIDVPQAFMQLLRMVIGFGVRLPPRLIYVAKVIGGLQTIGVGLDPRFQMLTHLRSFSARIWASQLGSRRAGNRLLDSALNWSDALLDAPAFLQDARRLVRNPHMRIHSPQAEMISETVDRVGFRTTFALVLSALLVSSALVVHADIQPQVNGIPVFGIIGFAIGTVMGIGFLFAGVARFFRWHRTR
ncbi:MAG: AarF/ABC1/UbiB kinase family protein, partial [Spirochaetaceae bacterium]